MQAGKGAARNDRPFLMKANSFQNQVALPDFSRMTTR